MLTKSDGQHRRVPKLRHEVEWFVALMLKLVFVSVFVFVFIFFMFDILYIITYLFPIILYLCSSWRLLHSNYMMLFSFKICVVGV